MLLVVVCLGTPEGSTAVVLVLKRLRRRDYGLKSHPTDWEKPGIEPATPGNLVCGRVPLLYQYWPVGFMLFRNSRRLN